MAQASAWYQVFYIPDLTLNKYQSLSESGVEGVLTSHASFLRQWHGICLEAKASLHLLYLYLPTEPAGMRLKLFLGLYAPENLLKELEILMKSSPLSRFYSFEPSSVPEVFFTAGSTITKRESVAEIFDPLASVLRSVHYVPELSTNEHGRLYDLWKSMESCSLASGSREPLGYRIDLYPSTDSKEAHRALSPVLRILRGQQGIKVTDNVEDIKRDDMAKRVCSAMEEWVELVETAPCFRANLYGFAPTEFLSKVLLNAVGAETLASGDFSVLPIRCDSNGKLNPLSRLGSSPRSYCSFPQQAHLDTWPTSYTLDEVAPLFRLPALFDGESIEIPKETRQLATKTGIALGTDLEGHTTAIELASLPKHGFFTGMPGSGKTNTMLHLATELHKQGIPFLALEPSKKEYRALLLDREMDDVYLFSPHLRSQFPLRINPLEFPRGVRLSEHIDALLEVFEGSFLLQGPTRMFLSRALQRSYEQQGWDVEDTNDGMGDHDYPTMADVRKLLKQEIDASSYNAELKGDLLSFLEVRLGGLLERDAGELFDTRVSTILPEDWLRVSAVIELEVLGNQATNFLVLLLCHYVFEGLRADPRGGIGKDGTPMPARHAIFIEEAHNLIAASTEQAGSDVVDPKVSATAYIVKMLAEVRALREAVFIADQLPTALAVEVTKNTGFKIVHRLGSSDDREQIGNAISASQLQLEQMATLPVGYAFVFHEDTQRPFLVRMALWNRPSAHIDVTSDQELFELCRHRMPQRETIRFALEALRYGEVTDLFEYCTQLSQAIRSEMLAGARNKDILNRLGQRSARIARLAQRLKARAKSLGDIWLIGQSDDEILIEAYNNVGSQIALTEEMVQTQAEVLASVEKAQ